MKIITTIVKVLSVITGLSAYADIIPAKFAPLAVAAFAVASSIKDVVRVIGDYADDKQLNQSFNPK